MNEMNDEELNVRLAELHLGYDPKGEHWQVCRDGIPRSPLTLPDFCADLNETAKVEATLTEEQHKAYCDFLIWAPYQEAKRKIGWNWADMDEDDYRNAILSTAKQRTIALIQTLQP